MNLSFMLNEQSPEIMLPANNSLHFVNMMFFKISFFFLLIFCIFVLRERVWVHQAVGIVVIDLLSVGSTVLILFLLFLTAIT